MIWRDKLKSKGVKPATDWPFQLLTLSVGLDKYQSLTSGSEKRSQGLKDRKEGEGREHFSTLLLDKRSFRFIQKVQITGWLEISWGANGTTFIEGLSLSECKWRLIAKGCEKTFWSSTGVGLKSSVSPCVGRFCGTERDQGHFLSGWSACIPFSWVVHARLRLWGKPKQWLTSGCSSKVHLWVAANDRKISYSPTA